MAISRRVPHGLEMPREGRIEKKVSGTPTRYIYSGTALIAEYASGAAPSSPAREYVWLGDRPLAKHEGATTHYYHYDQHTVRLITDQVGTVVGERGVYPYGEQWYATGAASPFSYTTYSRDSESGNDFAMFRQYGYRMGRFNSPDPLAGNMDDPQSLNRCSYVGNDPINSTDFLGLQGQRLGPPNPYDGPRDATGERINGSQQRGAFDPTGGLLMGAHSVECC